MTVAPTSQLPNLHSAAGQLGERAPDRRCSVVQIEVSSAQPSQLAPAQSREGSEQAQGAVPRIGRVRTSGSRDSQSLRPAEQVVGLVSVRAEADVDSGRTGHHVA